jgi:hypothetical protein
MQRGPGPVLLFTLTLSLLSLLPGCAARPANAPSSELEPDTVEAAQAQIEDARRALGMPRAAPSGSTAAAADAPPPPPPDAAKQSSSSAAPSGGEAEYDAQRAACGSSCNAIASMRRAVAALCRIAGNTDNRCVDAKQTLDASEQRVASCGCQATR